MILHDILYLIVTFTTIANAVPQTDSWEDVTGNYFLTASNWHGPYFYHQLAIDLVDKLSNELVDSALNNSAAKDTVYRESPFITETTDVKIQLANPERALFPSGFRYGSIQSLVLLLREFVYEWREEEGGGWVPQFDIRLTETVTGWDWWGNVSIVTPVA